MGTAEVAAAGPHTVPVEGGGADAVEPRVVLGPRLRGDGAVERFAR